jgi:hypothetical protein
MDRLNTLRGYKILDTRPEERFNDLARLAASVCGTPIALISFVDKDRQWFKSRCGVEAAETPRVHAFCAHAIMSPDLFIIPDAGGHHQRHLSGLFPEKLRQPEPAGKETRLRSPALWLERMPAGLVKPRTARNCG